MFNSILEYAVNADDYYRLWMVSEHQTPTPNTEDKRAQPRAQWLPDLVGMFDDVRDVPSRIDVRENEHVLDSEFRFHTGNKKPTIAVSKMDLLWGSTVAQANAAKSQRAVGPCIVTFTNLRMWHHQDIIHRRRGDAIICEQVDFFWNTRGQDGLYRANGPYHVCISGFRAAYNMGEPRNASYSSITVDWRTEDGRHLGEQKLQRVIAKNSIELNYHLVESVFVDPGEEFIFWDEVAREDVAA